MRLGLKDISLRGILLFMATMQAESKRASAMCMTSTEDCIYNNNHVDNNKLPWKTISSINDTDNKSLEAQYENVHAILLPKQKKKNKNKKRAQQIALNHKDKIAESLGNFNADKHINTATVQAMPIYPSPIRKINRSRKQQGWSNYVKRHFPTRFISSTVLRSIYIFFALLATNILVIYTIMFKNPEIAQKIVEAIPQKYRDSIIAKTEMFRVNIGDRIADFLTSPNEQ